MGMSIEVREVGSITVLDVSGESSIMDGTALQQTIKGLLQKGKRLFILNLEGLKHLDSFGLGQMVASFISVRDHKGGIKVVHPTSAIRKLFRYTRVDSVLQVVPTIEEAVQELQKVAAS